MARARKPKNTLEVVVKVVDCNQQCMIMSQQQHRQYLECSNRNMFRKKAAAGQT